MKHIIENYFQILSIVDLIKYQKGVYRTFYVIEKDNEQLRVAYEELIMTL